MAKPATVRALALDGIWETIGTDRAAGLWVENLVPEYDDWGPVKCTFDVRRHASRPWPDIGAFTPIDVEIAGVPVWSGRVSDTPARDGQERMMSVQCDGPQFHLDDDLYERRYAHRALDAWKDARTYADCPLGAGTGSYASGWSVAAGDGALTITKPKDYNPGAWSRAGIILDGGIPGAFDQLVGSITTSGSWSGGSTFYAGFGDTPADAFASAVTNLATLNGVSYTNQQFFYNLPTRARYIVLLCDSNAANATADEWLRFNYLIAFADRNYGASFESILKASTVVGDALDRATILLSSDRSGIQATSTSIPTFAPDSPQTPRQAWLAVDAFHDWVKQVDVYWRPIYKPKPAAPVLEVGSWAAGELNDTSANSGDEIYNKAIVTATAPSGGRIAETRRSSNLANPVLGPTRGNESIPNPSFDANVTGWSVGPQFDDPGGTGTISRDTSTFDTSPASLKLTYTKTPDNGLDLVLTHQLTGTFKAGVIYQLTVRVKTSTSLSSSSAFEVAFGDFDMTTQPGSAVAAANVGYSEATVFTTNAGGFVTATVTWSPDVSVTNPKVQIIWRDFGVTLNDSLWVDSLLLRRSYATLIDRRDFVRAKELPINAALPEDLVAAVLIGDTWLTGHKTTPFKGTRTLVGDGSIRDLRTGQSIGLHTLGLKSMELIRFSDQIDPDTGGVGRDGRMTRVRYIHAEDTAEVTIDNSRASFEALLARMYANTAAA